MWKLLVSVLLNNKKTDVNVFSKFLTCVVVYDKKLKLFVPNKKINTGIFSMKFWLRIYEWIYENDNSCKIFLEISWNISYQSLFI